MNNDLFWMNGITKVTGLSGTVNNGFKSVCLDLVSGYPYFISVV